MINFDLTHIEEDEESEAISAEISKLKAQGLTNNIDFEKAELERLELESKLQDETSETENNTETNNQSKKQEDIKLNSEKLSDDETLSF